MVNGSLFKIGQLVLSYAVGVHKHGKEYVYHPKMEVNIVWAIQ